MKNEMMRQNRNSGLLSPWFEEFFEPMRWMDQDMAMPESKMPAIDVDETPNEYLVSTDLPGVKKEDIKIECFGNQVSISAERKYEGSQDRKSGRRERFFGTYQRSFSLPSGVDANKIEATYEDGILTLRIPKGEERKSRRIEIGEKKLREQSTPHPQEKH